jgi:hypothetical protein
LEVEQLFFRQDIARVGLVRRLHLADLLVNVPPAAHAVTATIGIVIAVLFVVPSARAVDTGEVRIASKHDRLRRPLEEN